MIRYYNEFTSNWMICSLYNTNEYLCVFSTNGESISSILVYDYSIDIKVNCTTYYLVLTNKNIKIHTISHTFEIDNKYILNYWLNILNPLTFKHHSKKRYNILDKIGEGAFGKVYRALDLKTNDIIAVKEIRNIYVNIKNIINEVRILSNVNHKNILSLKDIYSIDSSIYIVTNIYPITLLQLIKSSELYDNLTCDDVISITYQCLCALDYIHDYHILHRDIKPSNILLTDDCKVVKLCDFGMSRLIKDKTNYLSFGSSEVCCGLSTVHDCQYTNYVVTRWYRAPEVLLTEGNYDKEQDIWALGCTIGELITSYPLMKGKNTFDQLFKMIALLGRPTLNDMNFITNPTVIEKIKCMKPYENILYKMLLDSRIYRTIQNKFNSLIYLVENMLLFHPFYRITAKQALKLNLFISLNEVDNEIETSNRLSDYKSNPFPISIVYANNRSNNLISLLYKEIEFIKYNKSGNNFDLSVNELSGTTSGDDDDDEVYNKLT